MTERVWMSDPYGAKAHVDQVDKWIPRGWSESDEPTGAEMVWCGNEATGGRAQFPASVLEQWQALGCVPSEPPEPVDLTKDPKLVDQPADSLPAPEPEPEQTETQTPGRRPRAGRPSETQE